MVCTPFTIPAGLFLNADQVTWNNFSETSPDGTKSVTHSASGMSISGPNGTTFLSAPANTQIRHRFFGTGNFLGILFAPTTTGLGTRTLTLADFTAPTLTTTAPLLQVLADSTTPLPFLQPCSGSGAACQRHARRNTAARSLVRISPTVAGQTNQSVTMSSSLATGRVRVSAITDGRASTEPRSACFSASTVLESSS